MIINKDTQICISLAAKAGNFGCSMHNPAFRKLGLNFIYKSLSVTPENLSGAIEAIRIFNLRGAGVTMPHKIEVLKYVNIISKASREIGSANTIVNDEGILTAYNTDAYSSYEVLQKYDSSKDLYILGNGGFAKSVKYSGQKIFSNIKSIGRPEWDKIPTIRDAIVFNCTPVRNIKLNDSVEFIDCCAETKTGQELAILQASKQFELYTGVVFPVEYIRENFKNLLSQATQYWI